MLIWIIFGSFLVIVAFVVFSLFGFLRQSKVIDFAWGLSYTDSSLIGQVNELFKRELSVGLVKPTVVRNLREKFGINGKNGQWLSRSVLFEIRFRSKLVWDFSKPFDLGNSLLKNLKKYVALVLNFSKYPVLLRSREFLQNRSTISSRDSRLASFLEKLVYSKISLCERYF